MSEFVVNGNETGQIVKKYGNRKKINDRNFRKIPGNSRREFGNAKFPGIHGNSRTGIHGNSRTGIPGGPEPNDLTKHFYNCENITDCYNLLANRHRNLFLKL